jgi:hypothetical protein
MPAPTIEPMTMAVNEESGSFCCSVEEAADAVEDVISLPFVALPSSRSSIIWREYTVRHVRNPPGPNPVICSKLDPGRSVFLRARVVLAGNARRSESQGTLVRRDGRSYAETANGRPNGEILGARSPSRRCSVVGGLSE